MGYGTDVRRYKDRRLLVVLKLRECIYEIVRWFFEVVYFIFFCWWYWKRKEKNDVVYSELEVGFFIDRFFRFLVYFFYRIDCVLFVFLRKRYILIFVVDYLCIFGCVVDIIVYISFLIFI